MTTRRVENLIIAISLVVGVAAFIGLLVTITQRQNEHANLTSQQIELMLIEAQYRASIKGE